MICNTELRLKKHTQPKTGNLHLLSGLKYKVGVRAFAFGRKQKKFGSWNNILFNKVCKKNFAV